MGRGARALSECLGDNRIMQSFHDLSICKGETAVGRHNVASRRAAETQAPLGLAQRPDIVGMLPEPA
jgi:hypothetical protein